MSIQAGQDEGGIPSAYTDVRGVTVLAAIVQSVIRIASARAGSDGDCLALGRPVQSSRPRVRGITVCLSIAGQHVDVASARAGNDGTNHICTMRGMKLSGFLFMGLGRNACNKRGFRFPVDGLLRPLAALHGIPDRDRDKRGYHGQCGDLAHEPDPLPNRNPAALTRSPPLAR